MFRTEIAILALEHYLRMNRCYREYKRQKSMGKLKSFTSYQVAKHKLKEVEKLLDKMAMPINQE